MAKSPTALHDPIEIEPDLQNAQNVDTLRITIPQGLTPEEMAQVEAVVAQAATWAGFDPGGVTTALAKAVAPHPAHVVQLDRKGRAYPDFRWRRESPRSLLGRFASRLTQEERTAAKALDALARQQFERALGHHYRDLRNGRLPVGEAAVRGREAIGEYYERMLRAGMQSVGNPAVLLSSRDRTVLDRIVTDEGDFWQGFMEDVAGRRGRMDYDERFATYVNASKEAFWLGYVLGDMRPGRRISWTLGPTDHCSSCLEMAGASPYSPEKFLYAAVARGFLPQSGSLECKGIRCQCRLEDR